MTQHNSSEHPKESSDVAIIGMACMFPGAPNLETYWQHMLDKVDAISDPPPEAWEPGIFFDPESTANDRVYCKRGGFLGPIADFNPLAYGIMPASLMGGEPDQWLALKVAHEALDDARYLERLKQNISERHRTAVIIGKGTYLNHGNLNMVQHSLVVDQTLDVLKTLHPNYSDADLQMIRQELKQRLPPFNAESAAGLVPNIIAGRIANRLDLMGPTYTVDAACASSLIAVDSAIRCLLTDQCDLALVGGAHVTTPIPILTLFCQLNALSRQQQIRPFDSAADGTILGEGIGFVVLKRCADAIRDGDRIYAVIKGVGVASDGRALGVLAPRVEGEMLALQRAYEQAQVAPSSLGLIEAHGTGTAAGDIAEIQAIGAMFKRLDNQPAQCALGSVKSMIGHTMPAAGIAGMIKAALALYHKTLPPTLHCEQPHPKLQTEASACYLNTETRPWIHGAATPRRAGVNAFGFGGINAHVVLEEAPEQATVSDDLLLSGWDSEVVILAADSRMSLVAQIRSTLAYLEATATVRLLDLAYSINIEGIGKPYRLALIAKSPLDLQQKLAQALKLLENPACHQIKDGKGVYFFEQPLYPEGKLAFLFPGEGAQYTNMLSDLCRHFPEVRVCFDQIDRVFAGHPRGYVPSDFIFPRPTGPDRDAMERHLWQIDGAIEAVLTANQALLTLLSRLQVQPHALAGHSTGEYSAMRASGIIRLSDEQFVGNYLMELNRSYQDILQNMDVPRGTLFAIGASSDRVSALIPQVDGTIYIALDNCPNQTVIVAEQAATDQVIGLLRAQGMIYEVLPFDRAYHTPFFADYRDAFLSFLERLPLTAPSTPIYSCTTSGLYPDDIEQIRAIAAQSAISTVRFRETILNMYADGVRLFVEVGPRGNLTSFVGDILRGRPHLAIPADLQNRSSIAQLNHLIGLLAAQEVPMNLEYLYQRRAPQKLMLDSHAAAPARREQPQGTVKLVTGWVAMGISPALTAQLQTTTSSAPQSVAQAAQAAVPATLPVPPISAQKTATNGHLKLPTPGDAQPATVPAVASAGRDPRTPVIQAHLQLMNQFLDVQQSVMQQFLSQPELRAAEAPVWPTTDQAQLVPAAQPATNGHLPAQIDHAELSAAHARADSGAQVGGAERLATPPEQVRQILLQLVSEKTGYPIEMLNASDNLEAELGIDSIKRSEILGAFKQQTGLLAQNNIEHVSTLKTLQEIIDFFANTPAHTAGNPAEAPDRQAPPFTPFIHTVSLLRPGQELTALVQIDRSEHLFLADHTLGRARSTSDQDLQGLPVVPLTISMEILAEAAAHLLPDRVFVGMRNVRAHRWMLLEDSSLTLRVVARRSSPSDEQIEVSIHEADDVAATSQKVPIIEGTMVFAAVHPEAPAPQPLKLQAERRSRWRPEQLYTEGMFHGPAFQAVTSVDRWGSDGAAATLRMLPTERFFRSQSHPSFMAEPVILDAAGQLIGFWTMEHLESGFVVFPYHLEALYLYGPRFQPGEHASCQARIELTNGGGVRSNIDIAGPDGQLRLRLVGWADKRFDIPRRLYQFILAPSSAILSEDWAAPLLGDRGLGAISCRWVMPFPDRFFEAHFGFWEKVLAHLILSRSEREHWRQIQAPARRRIDWLLGRVAAKDAVRLLVQRTYGIGLEARDIEIGIDDRGRPIVQGDWLQQLDRPVNVSIAHAGGSAVAIAGQPGDTQDIGLGIDIEPVARRDQDFASVAFTPSEQALLAEIEAAQPDRAWPLRLWCAKEAVGKALGHGLAGGPQALIATTIDIASGTIQLGLGGKLAQHFPNLDRPIAAYTVANGGFIVAGALVDQTRNE